MYVLKNMMKRILASLLLVCITVLSFGQILEPVKWAVDYKKISDTEGEIIFTATIEAGWHLYSQYNPVPKDGGGAQPLTFTFDKNAKFSLVGKVVEPKYIKEYSDIWESDEYFFNNKAVFKQKIKVSTTDEFTLKGSIAGQACKEICVQADNKFSVIINKGNKKADEIPVDSGKQAPLITVPNKGTGDAVLTPTGPNESYFYKLEKDDGKYAGLEAGCGDINSDALDLSSLWSILFFAFGAGLLALLTPCVFPMIPLTVSFFTKRSGSKQKGQFHAIVYGLSIILIYVIPGYLVTKIFGSDALNALATSAFFNWLFFIIFVVFAISFFGAFDITLPSSFVNRIDKASERGGLIGVFFMAFTLVLVSFSCTGPVLGTLMVEAVYKGGDTALVIGLFGFSLALALPFMVFALFPSMLKSLPKSGGWLTTVKVCLGFIELALALKFISNIDLAYHWGFLKRELFIGTWVAIFGAMAFYLLGFIKMAKDDEFKGISVTRLVTGLITLSFTLYVATGLFGGPVTLLAGYLPPAYYNEQNTETSHCPPGFNCFNDLDEGMNYAKQVGKPVMIDFTGFNCANCRKMEDKVFVDGTVKKIISDEYVLISLYCDDKDALPMGKNYVSKFSGEEITSIGAMWSDLQKQAYNANAQPLYVLVDNEGKLLNTKRSYNEDIGAFKGWLESGLCRYQLRKNATN